MYKRNFRVSLVSVFWIIYGNPIRYIVGSKYRSGYFPTFFERLSTVFSSVVSLVFEDAMDVYSCSRGLLLQTMQRRDYAAGAMRLSEAKPSNLSVWVTESDSMCYVYGGSNTNGNGSCLLQNTWLSSCISKNIIYIYIYIYVYIHIFWWGVK